MSKRDVFQFVLCLILVASLPLAAQEFRAGVSGTVTDQQGAVIAGVAIEARNLQTNQVEKTVTNEAGRYSLPVLPVGSYSITATLSGFKKAVRENIDLRVGDRVQLDFQMEVGAVAEQVTVTGQAELLETTTASRGQVIDATKVQNLPSLGRNPYILALLSTAAQYTNALASRTDRPFDGIGNLTINGGRPYTNELLLDGASNTNTETTNPATLGFVPSPDATEEFKVHTNAYDAQFGRTGGGVVSVSLKSGSNRLRGSLYEYFRNDKLNANTFESNLGGFAKSAFRWNQPGVELDGPVYLPKIYDGRNRTFFMYSWEAIRSSIPYPQTSTVPTLDQRNGDFNTTLQTNGRPITIYDPLTTTLSGGQYIRQPLTGNRVPPARLDPIAQKILPYIPKPNAAGTAAGANNLIASPNARIDEYDQHIIRIDQMLTEKHKFFSRYVRGMRHEVNSDNGFPGPASPQYRHHRFNHGAILDVTSTLSPALVVTSRLGFIRHQFGIVLYASGFDPTALGFPASLVSQLPRKFFPRIAMTEYTTFGTGRNLGDEITFSDTWSWTQTVNKTLGAHLLKFGGEFRAIRNNQDYPTSSFGDFTFTKAFTQANALRADAASGNAFASFLLGYPNSGSVPYNNAMAYENNYWVGFIQDDWRLSRTLTLNLGLRWDYESPITERYDQQNRGFDPNADNPFPVPGMKLKGGLLFTDKDHRLPFQRDLNNFQPRLGVAWLLLPKTVFRAGYGISYLPTFATGYRSGFSLSTPFVASLDGGLTPGVDRLSNPYPLGIQVPFGRAQGLQTLVGNGFTYADPARSVPYVHQISIGFQRELPWRAVAEIVYSGSRSRQLETSKAINEVSVEQLKLGTDLLTQVPNPFQGLLPGTAYNGATIPRQQLLRPFPQFTGITQARHPIGYAWYNSMQLRVEKRLSAGFHLLLSYTLSRSMEAVDYLNAQDPITALNRVLTDQDAPHRLIISGGYALPFFNRSTGIVRTMLGGWQVNAIGRFQSGLPVGAPSGFYSTGVNAAFGGDKRTRARWFNTCTLSAAGVRQNCATADEPVAFVVQQPYTLRTLSTRFPNIRTKRPGLADVSLFKAFAIHESLRLQFRAEAFNLLNTPWFGGPSTSLSSSNAGVVSSSQANDPRSVQLALKLLF